LPKAQRLIVSYLATASLFPVVIEAESGIGKYAVLAACASSKRSVFVLFCRFLSVSQR
jgi:hypothetical protein